jgi:predicted nuclease of predicted toxin-antitoxin system
MKLLFDQNISFRVVKKFESVFKDCQQVRLAGLENKTDYEIWNYAKENAYTIVTFDADFYDLVTLRGYPPKVIWLRTGNLSTNQLFDLLTTKKEVIVEFISSDAFQDAGCLEIH